jgi:hypothetical protein
LPVGLIIPNICLKITNVPNRQPDYVQVVGWSYNPTQTKLEDTKTCAVQMLLQKLGVAKQKKKNIPSGYLTYE